MKIKLRKMTVICFAVAFIIFAGLVACVDKDTAGKGETSKGVSDEELGIRKKTLFDEKDVTPATGTLTESGPGSGKKIARSFENAPPLIPHDITGMLPIALTNNMCMGCHMPEAATASGAVSIPPSHMMDLATGKDLKGELHGERYNCMQCHVQQVEIPAAVENIFKEDFRDERSKYNSNLAETLNEGVK